MHPMLIRHCIYAYMFCFLDDAIFNTHTGPTIIVKPGDVLTLTLNNNLSPSSMEEKAMMATVKDPEADVAEVTKLYNRLQEDGSIYGNITKAVARPSSIFPEKVRSVLIPANIMRVFARSCALASLRSAMGSQLDEHSPARTAGPF